MGDYAAHMRVKRFFSQLLIVINTGVCSGNANLTDPAKIDQMLDLAEHVKKGAFFPEYDALFLI